jgi:hypothetical protein
MLSLLSVVLTHVVLGFVIGACITARLLAPANAKPLRVDRALHGILRSERANVPDDQAGPADAADDSEAHQPRAYRICETRSDWWFVIVCILAVVAVVVTALTV